MSVTFTQASKAAFYRKLRAAAPRVKQHLTAANSKTAGDIVAMAKRLAPTEDGDLQDSIVAEPGNGETVFIVKAGGEATTRAGYDYSLGQEFGTQKMPANPFFYPSVRANRRTHRGRVTRALKKAIQEVGLGG